jgi:isocitrate dehydrogenase (NAD+)
MAMMLSATMMLHHLGEIKAANNLEKAISDVIAEGKSVTYDLKIDRNRPAATTSEVADAVIEKLKKRGGQDAK